ncbi:FAD binding domain-containing protein [Cucurbitaria berberidis CBS 394.84]|uniref:FAD binding domain-containing protein n=1 Tax=Cucurbitaria berberidis CBS 394.84 TaxID=1168544 RepID=A0A9P4G7B4_9PLEO|nr:FAD binding domain-containing protein [Cucurbitaria berberidis CBS 394.84]KAF1840329.1 FAD binding domain-containing protein [Cucurbitaria berberidis CBS 394.84]
MKVASVVSLSAFTATTLGNTFEPVNFNVTGALISNGINVAAIPELVELVERSSPSGCSIACTALKFSFANGSVLSEGTPAYENFTNSYWSAQQNRLKPHCVFKPSNALQVSTLVLLSRLTQCPFAVKGGGHAAFAGGSSIDGGITVALENLNGITLSSDKEIASIGPGNQWGHVYKTLEQYGVAVIGGRVASVGVSGLTLGGGISHFANAYGWACDNVESFEVVTASGIIVTASATVFPDLYWALRGGGNNFGIVTKFNMRTFVHGPMWGGQRAHLESEWDAVYRAYYNLARDAAKDTKQAQIVSFALQNGNKIAAEDLEYSDPTPWPAVFDEWKAIPAIVDGTAINNLSTLTQNLGAGVPDGIQETYWDRTFKLDKDIFKIFIDTFFKMLPAITDAAGILPVLSFQAITVPAMEKMQQNGGNTLGLDPNQGPVFICNLAIMWTNVADNPRIMAFSNDLYKRLVAIAGERGLNNDFIYMNFASPYQDVISSYGAASKEKLKKIAGFYDPTGIFQRLQPGYFKLKGAPYGAFPA